MQGRVRTASWILAVVLLSSAGRAAETADLPRDIFAVVNGETISANVLEAFFREHVRKKLFHGGSLERLRELRGEAADLLVQRQLLAAEARRRGLSNEEAVQKQLDALAAQYRGTAEWPVYQAQISEIRRQVSDSVGVELLESQVSEVVDPSPESLRRYYHENPQLFTEPERLHLSIILLSVPPSALAEEWKAREADARTVASQLADGADFATLAKEHSQHESASAGGDIGFVHKGQLSPELDTAIAGLRAGEMTQPIQILEGYAIVQLHEHAPAQLQPFDAVRERARLLLRRSLANQQLKSLIAGLRQSAKMEINEAIVKNWNGEGGALE